MQVILDTSTLIRFFTNDSPEKAKKVEKLIQEAAEIFIPDVVFPELEYVFDRRYNLPRNKIIEAFRFLAAQNNIKTSPYISEAIKIFEDSKLDMADSIIASQSKRGKLASFDKELLNIEGVRPEWN